MPIDTAEPGMPCLFSFQDRAICGTRDSVNAKRTGVVAHNGNVAIAMTTTADNTTKRTKTVFGDVVRARTTKTFITAEATVLAIRDGEPKRMPCPNHAALEPVIKTHMVTLTPWPWPSCRIFLACGQA